jgi:hypothetical protein
MSIRSFRESKIFLETVILVCLYPVRKRYLLKPSSPWLRLSSQPLMMLPERFFASTGVMVSVQTRIAHSDRIQHKWNCHQNYCPICKVFPLNGVGCHDRCVCGRVLRAGENKCHRAEKHQKYANRYHNNVIRSIYLTESFLKEVVVFLNLSIAGTIVLDEIWSIFKDVPIRVEFYLEDIIRRQ